MTKAFITQYNKISNVLQNNVIVQGMNSQSNALATWDTGATRSVITEELATKLGLVSYGKSRSLGIGGIVVNNNYLVDIELPSGVKIDGVQVAGSKELNGAGFDTLIGMDIIAKGDFAVSNYNGKTAFTYRTPSAGLIDFVKKINFYNVIGLKFGKGTRKRK